MAVTWGHASPKQEGAAYEARYLLDGPLWSEHGLRRGEETQDDFVKAFLAAGGTRATVARHGRRPSGETGPMVVRVEGPESAHEMIRACEAYTGPAPR